MQENILEIRNLQVMNESGKSLLHFPSLKIHSGEIHGIIGESGSGKSLTLLSVMRLLSPALRASGAVEYEGREIYGLRDKEMQKLRGNSMGMVFQEPMSALNPQMRCGAQIAETVRLHHPESDIRKQVYTAMELAGLTDLERIYNAWPHQLSGGQRQRVMIAMAIVNKPRLVLADEPTTALDSITAKAVMKSLVNACRTTGSALLIVSHDLKTIAANCEYVHVMRNGTVLQQGTASEVVGNPTHPYVLELLEALPTGWKESVEMHSGELKIEKLSKTFGKGKNAVLALQDISFSLSAGETLAVIGFSGSGKSTLARILTGLEKTGSGAVVFRGKPLLGKKVTGVQMVFQDPYSSLNNHISNLESVAEVLRVLQKESAPLARSKALQLLEQVGLSGAQGRMYPHQLSGGQRQRLCIARALAAAPEILVLDESVAALDPLIQKQILDLLRKIQSEAGLIYIFITHDLDVARAFSNKFLLLSEGREIGYGTASQLQELENPDLILKELKSL